MATTCFKPDFRKHRTCVSLLMFILLCVNYFSAQTGDFPDQQKRFKDFELVSIAEAEDFDNMHTVKIALATGTHSFVTTSNKDCLHFDTITLKDPAVLIFSDRIRLVEYNIVEEGSLSDNYKEETEMNLVAGGSGVPGKEEGPEYLLQPPAAAFCENKEIAGIVSDPTMPEEKANQLNLFIPNAFSPDGNGHNDFFKAFGEGIQNLSMNIFDKNGKLVFYNDNNETGWDGRLENGRIPERSEVYVYCIHVTDFNGKVFTYTGHVTLIK